MSTKKSDLWTHWAAAVAMVAVIATISWSDTYRVINTDDTGDGSLRWAIESANDNPGLDDIVFNIKKSGPHMIQPTFPLPELKEEVVIDGYTQPGAKYATDHSNAVLKIVLDGSLTPDTTGLSLSSATHGCSIKGLKIQQFKLAIGIDGHDNSVEGNHILDGVYEGIGIMKAYNTVGGVTPEQRNVVTGNNVAIWISPSSAHNRIQGNYIGTDADGQYDASTDGMEGVAIGGSDNTVADNVISGYEQGVTILRWSGEDPLPENNVIEGNKIGTNADGTSPIPNGLGILINTGVNTTVKGNLITRNTFSGVVVENDLPFNSEEDLAVGNIITQNAIYNNGELGINLRVPEDPGWVTPNDTGDNDTGPNNLMNYPVLTSAMATPGRVVVKGYIDTPNPKKVTLEFFANQAPDDSDYGEGEIYLGTAKPNANGDFTAALAPVASDMWISATATDSEGNTSEFALSIEAEGPGKGKK